MFRFYWISGLLLSVDNEMVHFDEIGVFELGLFILYVRKIFRETNIYYPW